MSKYNLDKLDTKNRYRMLDRMRSDCEYCINSGSNKHLWVVNDPKTHCDLMRELYDSLEDKPDWLSLDDIDRYEKTLLGESLKEDTVKTSDGKWTNKGKEGTHGKFKTKKQADAQRKAMFANGFHESMPIKTINGKETGTFEDDNYNRKLAKLYIQYLDDRAKGRGYDITYTSNYNPETRYIEVYEKEDGYKDFLSMEIPPVFAEKTLKKMGYITDVDESLKENFRSENSDQLKSKSITDVRPGDILYITNGMYDWCIGEVVDNAQAHYDRKGNVEEYEYKVKVLVPLTDKLKKGQITNGYSRGSVEVFTGDVNSLGVNENLTVEEDKEAFRQEFGK